MPAGVPSYAHLPPQGDHSVGIVLPSWFLKVVGSLAAVISITLLPWVVWQTKATMRIEIRQESVVREMESQRKSTEALETKIESQNDRIDEQGRQIYRLVEQYTPPK